MFFLLLLFWFSCEFSRLKKKCLCLFDDVCSNNAKIHEKNPSKLMNIQMVRSISIIKMHINVYATGVAFITRSSQFIDRIWVEEKILPILILRRIKRIFMDLFLFSELF